MIAGSRPFVTWHSFSILTCFLATLGMSTGVILCFSLMAFGIDALVRNSYFGFLVFLTANAIFVALPLQIPNTRTAGLSIRYGSMLTPVWL
jgi:hypothetical protein